MGVKPIVLLIAFVLLVGAMSLVLVPQAHAFNTCIWDGSNSTWETASHWTSCAGLVPQSGDDVVINSGTVTVTANENIEFGGLTMSGSATLIVNSGVTLTVIVMTVNGGNVVNNGTIVTTTSGTLTNSGTITNKGMLIFFEMINNPSGTITNFGKITTETLGNEGTITNCGGTITGTITGNSIVQGGSACTIAPIPEYPFGLPILAILLILGYAIIKRRTSK